MHEARAHRALCIYTDYPPMNEFFNKQTGIPVREGRTVKMDGDLPGADGFRVSVSGIENAMSIVNRMNYKDRQKMGEASATSFYHDRVKFLRNSRHLLRLLENPRRSS